MSLRLLDLFCGAGGAAVGYAQAGFTDIVGVDIEPQPDYPFEFLQGNVLDLDPLYTLEFDLVHMSPPCQTHSTMSNRHRSDSPNLIPAARALNLNPAYVMENVDGAKRYMNTTVRLTGGMFDLPVYRPRRFECSFAVVQPGTVGPQPTDIAVYGKPDGRRLWTRKDGTELRAWSSVKEGQDALGIAWTDNWHQLREAIPPAYTQYIGEQYLSHRPQLAARRNGEAEKNIEPPYEGNTT